VLVVQVVFAAFVHGMWLTSSPALLLKVCLHLSSIQLAVLSDCLEVHAICPTEHLCVILLQGCRSRSSLSVKGGPVKEGPNVLPKLHGSALFLCKQTCLFKFLQGCRSRRASFCEGGRPREEGPDGVHH
jgi:hypothetical protein